MSRAPRRCSLTRSLPPLSIIFAAACAGDAPILQPVLDGEASPAAFAVSPAVSIDPISGNFSITAADADGTIANETPSMNPLTSFSRTVATGLSSSDVNVSVTSTGGSQIISVGHAGDVALGGSESSVSFSIGFTVLEEVSYEIYGGLTGSLGPSPLEPVQFETHLQFNAFNPFDVLYLEGDNTLTTTSASFTMNGVNEGSIGGNVPSTGARTGILQPGSYSFDGGTSVFGRNGGFSATGSAEIAIRLTPTTPHDPALKDDCLNGGWQQFGFSNPGQCVRFVASGHDSR
jgi:hypothetical protein